MKTIKTILILFLCINYLFINAQEKNKRHEIALNGTENAKLKLINLSGNVEISASNSNKIVIEASGIKPKPKRAEGLKRIGAGGEDNTGIGLSQTKNGNEIKLIGVVSMSADIDYEIKVPKDLDIYVELGIFNNGSLEIKDLSSDLELDVKNSDIELKNVTGPTVISSLSGDIEAEYSKISQASPFSIKAISGDIDITIPENTPADLELGSISGGIYSNFEINPIKEGMHVIGGSKVKTKLNNGGVKIRISAISGNIYLRKKK